MSIYRYGYQHADRPRNDMPCSYCRAEPGQPCRTRDNRKRLFEDIAPKVDPAKRPADLLAMTDDQVRTRAVEIGEEIDQLASRARRLDDAERDWLLGIIAMVNDLDEIRTRIEEGESLEHILRTGSRTK